MSHIVWQKGKVDDSFKDADIVIEHEFETQPVHQGHLEPHACIARVDEHGQLRVGDREQAGEKQCQR